MRIARPQVHEAFWVGLVALLVGAMGATVAPAAPGAPVASASPAAQVVSTPEVPAASPPEAGGCPGAFPADLGGLVAAERAFAAETAASGIKSGFLAFLAEDAVVFRPLPIPARPFYAGQDTIPGLLTWRPEHAAISQAGDLGFTTGPWEFREGGVDASPDAHGHYVSLWRRDPRGCWRVIVDVGVPHDPPAQDDVVADPLARWSSADPAAPAEPRRWKLDAAVAALDARRPMNSAEHAFQAIASSGGPAAALDRWAAQELRLYRAGAMPARGLEAALRLLAARPLSEVVPSWSLAELPISRSGDLGYAYGTFPSGSPGGEAPAPAGGWLRIWRRDEDGAWRLVLDLQLPASEQGQE